MPAPAFVVAPIAALLNALGAIHLFQPGYREHDGANIDGVAAVARAGLGQNSQAPLPAVHSAMQLTGLFYESAADNLVAAPGGGAPNALQLGVEVNRLTIVASPGDSVALPQAYPGLTVVVVNHGAQAAGVFGAQSGAAGQPDTINDLAAVSQMPGSEVIYVCITPGKWYANGLGTGYSGSLQTQSLTNALTAHAGGGQAAAQAIGSMVSRFTTVATAGDSAVLPPALGNVSIGPITVINAGAASMNVFPAGTDAIGTGGAGAAFAVPAGKVANFYSAGPGVWHSVLSA